MASGCCPVQGAISTASHPALSIRACAVFERRRNAKGLLARPEPGEVGAIGTVQFLSGTRVEGHLAKAVHLFGPDDPSLVVPNPADATIADAGDEGDPCERSLDVLAESQRASDEFDKRASFGLGGGHDDCLTFGTSSRDRG